MSTHPAHDQDCTCDACGRELPADDYEHQEHLRIDFKAGYASVFGDGNTVRAVLCQHCVQKHLGPWLTIIEASDEVREPQDCHPRHATQPYQLRAREARMRERGATDQHPEQRRGWLARAARTLWDLPVWVVMLAAGGLMVVFILILSSQQYERGQLVLTAQGCQAMAAHGVVTDPFPDSTLCRISGLYDRGKLASKTATIRVETDAGVIEVRLSHAEIVSHASQ